MILLILVYCLIALTLVTVVTSASAVHLARHRLMAIADGAALDAADALDQRVFYTGATGSAVVPVSDATVRASVSRYLPASVEAGRFSELSVVSPTGSLDGATAEVTLAAVVQLPLLSSVLSRWAPGVSIRVTARARASRLP